MAEKKKKKEVAKEPVKVYKVPGKGLLTEAEIAKLTEDKSNLSEDK